MTKRTIIIFTIAIILLALTPFVVERGAVSLAAPACEFDTRPPSPDRCSESAEHRLSMCLDCCNLYYPGTGVGSDGWDWDTPCESNCYAAFNLFLSENCPSTPGWFSKDSDFGKLIDHIGRKGIFNP